MTGLVLEGSVDHSLPRTALLELYVLREFRSPIHGLLSVILFAKELKEAPANRQMTDHQNPCQASPTADFWSPIQSRFSASPITLPNC